jgi:hypothetical protein
MTKSRSAFIALLFSILALLAFSACTVTKNEGENGKDKVDIKTPFGSLKVNENVDPRDTGLPLYAGAKPYEKGDREHSAANVNISSEYFALKVVAAEFTTPDPPEKVRDFYQNALKSYGKVIECKGSYSNKVDAHKGSGDSDKPVDCSDVHGNANDEIQLKVGTEHHQRVVGVKPDGNGTRFALVYVNTRGKESGS